MKTGTEPRVTISVLGISHQIQGVTEGTFAKIVDPSCGRLIEDQLRSLRVDFVFEEAAELGPTLAEKLAARILGENHYLDVDPSPDNIWKYGIPGLRPECCRRINPTDPTNTDFVRDQDIYIQDDREKLWVNRVKEQPFTSALFICGYLHTLSLAFRLRSESFLVTQVSAYIPHNKLCTLPHR